MHASIMLKINKVQIICVFIAHADDKGLQLLLVTIMQMLISQSKTNNGTFPSN